MLTVARHHAELKFSPKTTKLGQQTAGGERVSYGARLVAKAPTQAGCGFSALIVTYVTRTISPPKGDETARTGGGRPFRVGIW
jgi:hypothetical protein